MSDPFARLGLPRSATADDVRRARRELAKRAHPDVGGDAATMRELNDAAATALRLLGTSRGDDASAPTAAPAPEPTPAPGDGRRSEVPSFTVEALPAETFEALLLAAAALGQLGDDDPPYALAVLLDEPLTSWCQLSVVPDAGASTVSVAVWPVPDHPAPSLDAVRDAWVGELNRLDWSRL